jgi:cyclic pyranopterin monophosphate synthase
VGAVYTSPVKLYRFDGVDATLDLLPLAARRALDHAGRKLSLDGFRSLPLTVRRALTELGSADAVDVERVIEIAASAKPEASRIDALGDPPGSGPDAALLEALGTGRPVPAASWSALTPLDRYTLAKVAQGKNPERRQQAYEEIIGLSAFSSHVAPEGGVRMVAVGGKVPSQRRAEAESCVSMNEEAFERVASRNAPKGDVLGTARIAAIMAAKRTAELIPLCHPLSLTRVDVVLSLRAEARAVNVQVVVECFDRTGVEMEALTAASVAALTVYDMLKAFDRSMTIGPTRLTQKSGGRTGDYER